jgi:hypothetical protein
MEINFSQANVVQVQGLGPARQSQMKTSPLAFEILSKKLYKNKVQAPIRELSANAVDAHVMVNTPERPIEVKLPTEMDGQFYVRDHGPGLSEEDIMNLYMTYFDSTKSGSNDFTGGFGLGSKSPFCYVDQFYVTSAHNGIQTTYIATRNNAGFPTIARANEEEEKIIPVSKDWPHGLQVGFPVPAGDFERFAAEAAAVFRWFPVKPTIHGVDMVFDEKFAFEGEQFSIPSKANGNDCRSFVVMGPVGYLVEAHETSGHLTEFEQALLTSGIALKVVMGEVSITASRESLEYDPKTIAALKQRVAYVAQTLADKYADAIGLDADARTMETIQSGVQPFREAFKSNGVLKLLAEKAYAVLVERARAAGKDFDLTLVQVTSLVCNEFMAMPDWLSTSFDLKVNSFVQSTRTKNFTSRKVEGGLVGRHRGSLHFKNWPVAVIVGDAKGAAARVRVALQRGDFSDALLITCDDEAKRDAVVERVSKYFINLPVVLASTLPALPSNRVPRAKKVKEAATGGRQRIEDRLEFWGHMAVRLHTFHQGVLACKDIVLSEALKETNFFMQVHGTSDYFVNHTKSAEVPRDNVKALLTGLCALNPEFAKQDLNAFIELRGSQVNQLKAHETMEPWDKAVFETLTDCEAEIDEFVSALPCVFSSLNSKPAAHVADSPEAEAYNDNALVKHVTSWMHRNSDIFSLNKGKGMPFDRFMESLTQDLRLTVEFILAAHGHARDKKASLKSFVTSQTELAGRVLGCLVRLAPSEESQEVASTLLAHLRDDKDFAFYSRISKQSVFFKGLKTGYEFSSIVEYTPEQAASFYNVMWEAGRASIAQLELVEEAA